MELYLKFFFLLTPFFAISTFIAMTAEFTLRQKRRLAVLVGLSGIAISLILLFCGSRLFQLFGITVDSFRIGGGLLLLLSGISMVNNGPMDKKPHPHGEKPDEKQDEADAEAALMQIAVVPLAIPIIIGPATISMLLLMGAELKEFTEYLHASLAMIAAMSTVALMLGISGWMEKRLGKLGLTILSKITGLILVAMASQLIIQGIKQILIP